MKQNGTLNTEFLPDAVLWSEGMLLSPQHFQQHDIQSQAMLHQRLLGISPHVWGVRHLLLDTARLAKGLIKLLECDAVMPDGLPLVFRAVDDERVLSIDVDAECGIDGKPVRVFLAIPPRTGAMDVPTTSIRRFEPVKGRETFDETIGTGDVVVDRQRVKLSLHTDGTLPSGYPSLPLLAVRRNATGMVELAPYHPPLLRIGASSFLAEQGLERQFLALRDAMWEKIAQLVGVTGEDVPESLAALGTEARSHLHAARTIAACLPLIDAVLSDPLTSPAQAWNTMAQIVGRMAAIGSDPRPLAMDPYRHDDCQPHFQAALAFVQRKLGLIRTAWDSMAFDRIGEGVFSRRLPEDMHGPVLIELRIGEGQTAAGMLDWLQHARIGSDDLLPVLRQRRVPGAEVRALGKEEIATLGLRPDALIFALAPQALSVAQGEVMTFRGGRSLVVHGETGQGPTAIVLHRQRDLPKPAGGGHA
jgi:type VI secretion system protein ImpJ